jgi:uncharacterized protein with PIN domain
VNPGGPFRVRLRFHGDLSLFVKGAGAEGVVERELNEPGSVKDVIEACGIPHPEIDRILVDSEPVGFAHVLRNNSAIDVYPVLFTDEHLVGEPLQRHHVNRFVADGHLGKLSRNLRLLGFDVAYDNQAHDPDLLEVMRREARALLTRDRRLLMHAVVQDGYCPRSDDPNEQTIEVIRRFNLEREIKPFTRCLQCNGILQPVDKAEIIDQLEPLTRIFYEEFRWCTGCGKIFWRGSHFAKLEGILERFRGTDEQEATEQTEETEI